MGPKYRRNDAIVTAYLDGATMASLAKQYGLTKMRISQIVRDFGVERREVVSMIRRHRTRRLGVSKMPPQQPSL